MSLGVVITAGGGGIGLALAKAFSRRGDRVHIGDCDGDALAAAGDAVTGKTLMDVCDERQVDALFNDAANTVGEVDVLVCGAGIAGVTALTEDISPSDWRRCMAVSADGTFLCARRIIPHMKSRRGGLIVAFSSTAGLFGYPRRAAYCAAKWAVIGLVKTLAMELGPFNIRVNALCPGAVEGERMRRVIRAQAKLEKRSEAAVRREYAESVSLRTFVAAADIAAMVLFLASPAGEKISGQALAIDGHTESVS